MSAAPAWLAAAEWRSLWTVLVDLSIAAVVASITPDCSSCSAYNWRVVLCPLMRPYMIGCVAEGSSASL